jgi:hypothetical protein
VLIDNTFDCLRSDYLAPGGFKKSDFKGRLTHKRSLSLDAIIMQHICPDEGEKNQEHFELLSE